MYLHSFDYSTLRILQKLLESCSIDHSSYHTQNINARNEGNNSQEEIEIYDDDGNNNKRVSR